MIQILQILDLLVGLFTVMVFTWMMATRMSFGKLCFYMMWISALDMIVDGLQGDTLPFLMTSLMCVFWTSSYRYYRNENELEDLDP